MTANHAQNPSRRHTGFGNGHLDIEENLRVHLEATVALRLQNAEEPGVDHFAHGFGWQLAVRVSLVLTRFQSGEHRPGALYKFIASRDVNVEDVGSGSGHGWFPRLGVKTQIRC